MVYLILLRLPAITVLAQTQHTLHPVQPQGDAYILAMQYQYLRQIGEEGNIKEVGLLEYS
jgi:hypothetical protein